VLNKFKIAPSFFISPDESLKWFRKFTGFLLIFHYYKILIKLTLPPYAFDIPSVCCNMKSGYVCGSVLFELSVSVKLSAAKLHAGHPGLL
jgi:hypothetical protein